MPRDFSFPARTSAGPIVRAAAAVMDTLEARQLFNITLDAQGWSVIDHEGVTDFKQIYVSTSVGNNSWDGTAPDFVVGTLHGPKKTIAAGTALLRNNRPDWLLLKKGDAFNETLYGFQNGLNADNPAVFTSYGTGARPVVYGNGGTGLGNTARNNVAYLGIDFYNRTADPTSASFNAATDGTGTINMGGRNILVEDCAFNYRGVVSQGTGDYRFRDITFRRNIFANAYSTTSAHMQGLYGSSIDRITIEDNVFYRSGWNPYVPGAGTTIYNHAIYLQWSTYEARLSGNIVIQPSSVGAQVRGGGVVDNNLWLDNEYAFFTSQAPSIARENVVMSLVGSDASYLNAAAVSQAGIQNFAPVQFTEGNIVANRVDVGGRSGKIAYEINPDKGPNGSGASPASSGQGYYDLPPSVTTFRNNIDYNWGASASTTSNNATTQITGNYFGKLEFTGNTIYNDRFPVGSIKYGPTALSGKEHFDRNQYYTATGPVAKQYQIGSTYYTAAAWQAKTGETNATLAAPQFVDPTRSALTYLRDRAGIPRADAVTFYGLLLARSKDNWQDGLLTAGKINDYVRDGFAVAGAPANVEPTVKANVPVVMKSGVGLVIGTSLLNVDDLDGTPDQTTYFLEQLPVHGTLRLSNAQLQRFMTFTQADIDAGRLTYENNGDGAASDSFGFRASDGHHGTIAATKFVISPTAVDPDPGTEIPVDPPVLPTTYTLVNAAPQLAEGTAFSVAETAPVNRIIGKVVGTDADAGQHLTWSIDGYKADDLFRIDPNTGEIRVQYFQASYGSGFVARKLDFETTQNYTLTVRLTDDATHVSTATTQVIVNVTDVNEAPIVPATATYDIGEDTLALTKVATLGASDVDANDALTYSIVSGNTGNKFTVDAAGDIYTAGPLAYSTLGQYVLTVRATDKGGLKTDGKVTVNVKALPKLITNLGSALNAEQTTVIGTTALRVTDLDTAADKLVYALDALPALGEIDLNGIALAAGAKFTQADIDAGKLSYRHFVAAAAGSDSFAFTTRDERGSAVSGTFAITIIDAPPVLVSSQAIVAGKGALAIYRLTAVATDDRLASNLTYTWTVDDRATGFEFGRGNGTSAGSSVLVTLSESGTFTLRVTVSDGFNPSVSQTLSVTNWRTIDPNGPLARPGRKP